MKFPKSKVDYEDPAKGSDHCQQCVHYVVPNSCRKVEGRILAGAWCKLFTPKDPVRRSGMRG